MATLNAGVIAKLLEDMNSSEKSTAVEQHRSPMLQVRSIVPVMEEGDLWPNRGFYLKVSDSSHAMYVSLPHEYDEMIFNNKLKIGQYIYVHNLESATPVPILRGIKLVPGRHPCLGSPEDLGCTKDLIGGCFADLSLSDTDSMSEKGVVVKKTVERPRSLSASRASQNVQGKTKPLRFRSIPMAPKRYNLVRKNSDVVKEISDIIVSCSDMDSDSDSSNMSLPVNPKSKRRSWNGTIAGYKEWSSSPVIMHEEKPLGRSRSTGSYPCYSGGYDTDDSSSCKSVSSFKSSIRRSSSQTPKVVRSSVKQRCPPKEKHEIPKPVPYIFSDRKSTETTVSWDSLPPDLVKLGKEVLHHKDSTLGAAIESLQEACAAERLLQCLSTYSELQLIKGNNPQAKVVNLLNLYENISLARMVFIPLRTDSNSINPGTTKEALKLISERKKCATSWIRAAVASDLSIFPDPVKTITAYGDPVGTPNKSGLPTLFSGQKLATVTEFPADCVKGSSIDACVRLDTALQGECRKSFLTCVEEFLDGIMNKTVPTESDSQLAGVMCQIKRVNDWLDVIMRRENNSPEIGGDDESVSEDEDNETCQRLRNKLYMVLLKNVERSAMALENMSSTMS
ncbi:hypothetical protein ACHQM5_024942 [Ranunculus cassubicifolius]